jgi:glutaredoxin
MTPELFQRWYDPDCAKVRDYLEKNNLASQVEYVDVDEDDYGSSELISLRGSDEVPCLVVDDETILGSAKIIDYLSEHLLGRGDAVIT